MPCRKRSSVPLPAIDTARRGAGATLIVSRLLRLRARDLHRAGAALAVLADIRGEFVGRAADHLVAFVDELLLAEVRFLQDASHVEMNLRNCFLRRTGRQEEAEPRVG